MSDDCLCLQCFDAVGSAHLGSPGKRAIKWVCVCVCACRMTACCGVNAGVSDEQYQHGDVGSRAYRAATCT